MINELSTGMLYAVMLFVYIFLEFYFLLNRRRKGSWHILFAAYFALLTLMIQYRLFPMRFRHLAFPLYSLISFLGAGSDKGNLMPFIIQFILYLFFGVSMGILYPLVFMKSRERVSLMRTIRHGLACMISIESINLVLIILAGKNRYIYDSAVVLFFGAGLPVGWAIQKLLKWQEGGSIK